ncbi:MAG: enoyl-CoA hydratase/isomerase family protein, partial [Opitutales bacterium]|nr:enoyl-CoA hydratase/isomerase family protein [Opitutales bacterium]
MPTQEATLYEIKDGAAWITLNRPENRNALSSVLVLEMYEHLVAANEDPNVRCIVLTGTGPAFCAGADLKSPPGASIEGRKSVPYPTVLTQIMDSDKPVIAAVNGAAGDLPTQHGLWGHSTGLDRLQGDRRGSCSTKPRARVQVAHGDG